MSGTFVVLEKTVAGIISHGGGPICIQKGTAGQIAEGCLEVVANAYFLPLHLHDVKNAERYEQIQRTQRVVPLWCLVDAVVMSTGMGSLCGGGQL